MRWTSEWASPLNVSHDLTILWSLLLYEQWHRCSFSLSLSVVLMYRYEQFNWISDYQAQRVCCVISSYSRFYGMNGVSLWEGHIACWLNGWQEECQFRHRSHKTFDVYLYASSIINYDRNHYQVDSCTVLWFSMREIKKKWTYLYRELDQVYWNERQKSNMRSISNI